MFHMPERQLSLSSLFKKKTVHNAIRHFSCFYVDLYDNYQLYMDLAP